MPDPHPVLSARARGLQPSATLAMNARAKAMKRDGIDIVSFGVGEPDFDTPEPIRRACAEALAAGQTRYAPTLGDAETRGVIAAKLARENGLAGIAADHVAISAGAKHSLYLVCQCLLDGPGSIPPAPQPEVLLPVPAWVSYAPIAELAGGKVIELPTTAASDFKISPEQLRRAITPRSRALFLNSPSNPCGTMYTPDELRALAAVVAEAARSTAPDLAIITDEIYEKIVYGGIPHFSIGSVPEVAGRTVTINGLSKTYAMTGWRVGYAAAPGEFGLRLMKAMDALQGQMTSGIASFVLPAIRVALTRCSAEAEQFREAFARRAELMHARSRAIPGFIAPRPTGAFYIFPDVSAFFGRKTPGGRAISNAADFADALLTEAHVATVPGAEFGGCGKNHIRVSFACSEETIGKGMDRIAGFIASLR